MLCSVLSSLAKYLWKCKDLASEFHASIISGASQVNPFFQRLADESSKLLRFFSQEATPQYQENRSPKSLSVQNRNTSQEQTSDPCEVLEISYWCNRELKLPFYMVTPLRSKISCVRVCVAIQFVMRSFNEIRVHDVRMASTGDSNANARSGEGFNIVRIAPELLRELVEKELQDNNSTIRRAMYGVWMQSKTDRSERTNTREQPVEDELPSNRYRRIAAELGLKFSTVDREDDLVGMIHHENTRRERESQTLRFGEGVLRAVDKWEQLAKCDAWMLVIYRRGKSLHAYVVRINGAHVSEKGVVMIDSENGKIERAGGLSVGLGRYAAIPFPNIVWFEIVPEIRIEAMDLFRSYVARVEAMKARITKVR